MMSTELMCLAIAVVVVCFLDGGWRMMRVALPVAVLLAFVALLCTRLDRLTTAPVACHEVRM